MICLAGDILLHRNSVTSLPWVLDIQVRSDFRIRDIPNVLIPDSDDLWQISSHYYTLINVTPSQENDRIQTSRKGDYGVLNISSVQISGMDTVC